MRLFNNVELRRDMKAMLGVTGNDDRLMPVLTWLSDSASKWLLKNDEDFRTKFTSPVLSQSYSMLDSFESFYYKDVSGRKQRAYLEDEFDQKDARAQTLFVYVPKSSLWHWLANSKYQFVLGMEYLQDVLDQNPNADLRKITPAQLPQHVERWQAEYNARKERERLELLLAQQRAQELIEAAEAARRMVAQQAIEEYRSIYDSARDEERADALAKAWKGLIKGLDYSVEFEVGDQVFLRLLSKKALAWEAMAKGNCIDTDSYRRRLHDKGVVLGSLRHKEDLTVCSYTIEATKTVEGWFIDQFEAWGYQLAGRLLDKNSDRYDNLKRDTQTKLNSYKLTQVPPQSVTQEFVLTTRS